MKQPIYNTALYLRLSRDDDNAGESNSIATQRMMLRRYAEQNSLFVADEYIDDGYRGTNFERPRHFPQSQQGVPHTPREGAHYGAYAPLGYRKDPAQTGHLLVDDETKWIIEKIYALALQGAGAARITHILATEQIPTPSWLNFQRYGTFAHIFEGQPESRRYEWTITQVRKILLDETYIGHSIHNKQAPVSFKCKKRVNKPKDECWKVENTREAIISKADFDRVQQNIWRSHSVPAMRSHRPHF